MFISIPLGVDETSRVTLGDRKPALHQPDAQEPSISKFDFDVDVDVDNGYR